MVAATRTAGEYDKKLSFPQAYGIQCVRGCEVEGMLDSRGHVIDDFPQEPPEFKTKDRTFRVLLDSNQYQTDLVSWCLYLFQRKIKH